MLQSNKPNDRTDMAQCEDTNVVYHEMNDLDSDGAQDTSSTAGLDEIERNVGFWKQPRKYGPCSCCHRYCRWLHCRKFTGRELFLLCLTTLFGIILAIFVSVTWQAGPIAAIPSRWTCNITTLQSDCDIAPYCVWKNGTCEDLSPKISEPPTCTTRACVEVASMLASSMDETVNPCDDFYEFSCGGWEKKNPLPSGHAYWDTFSIQKKSIQMDLKNLLEEEIKNNTKDSAERKAKIFYKTCLNLTAINDYGIEPLLKLVKEIGGWSVFGEWDNTTFDLNAVRRKLEPFGLSNFFSVGVDTDLKHVDKNILQVDNGHLSLSKRKFYVNKTLDDKILKAYHEFMVDVTVLLGADKNKTSQAMTNIILFEQKLANIQMPAEKARQRDRYYKYMTISQLQEMTPIIDWMEYIGTAFKNVLPDEKLKPTEKIATSSEEYLQKLTDVIKTTSNETLNNFMIWHLVSTFTGPLGQDFIDARTKMNKAIYGSDSSCNERWRSCVSTVDTSLGLALGKLFITSSFDHKSKDRAELMVTEIKNAFKRNLPKTSWVDKETEAKAIKKVDAVRDMIGFPDYILNETRVNSEYMDFDFTEKTSYFDVIYKYYLFIRREELKMLRKKVDKDDWEMTPPTLNAYYSPTENTIVFPAGILQPPAYSSSYPQSINFGGIGLVVGHELTHGFDDQGRKFGLDGNLNNWWKNETAEKFKKKAECMIEQYSNYKIGGRNINGNITVGENIADNGGLRLAYDAYMHWRENGDADLEDPLLPSLNYTRDQLFFIGFAQLWCSVSTPEYMKKSVLVSVHSPSKIRVLGTASNSKEFAKAFQCPIGSPMNPENKCSVW
uniref:endothelin-converting enzyme 2-like isoform X3 n=1 Tax=Styela clava TaxID=7725 RepID=UPI00193A9473|nr:endothelin-converting enzyme 2-like isoform X3 [Styela clava]